MPPDMTLRSRHGFYELTAQTDKGRALVDKIRVANSPSIGTDFEGKAILLDSFFATAADWCARNVVAAGMVLLWDGDIYHGDAGIAALDFG